METHIVRGVAELQLPISLLPAGERSDYRIYLVPRFTSRVSMLLYQKVTGRSEDATLELYDPRGQRVIVSYDFDLNADEHTQKRAAREFLRLVKQRLSDP